MASCSHNHVLLGEYTWWNNDKINDELIPYIKFFKGGLAGQQTLVETASLVLVHFKLKFGWKKLFAFVTNIVQWRNLEITIEATVENDNPCSGLKNVI
jgi:hypothetical protein